MGPCSLSKVSHFSVVSVLFCCLCSHSLWPPKVSHFSVASCSHSLWPLSVKDKRAFLCKENFRNPYQGWLQSAAHRTVSGGLYFVLQGMVHDAGVSNPFFVGLVAGCLNGALLNPLAAIKYHNWGSEKFSFSASLRSILNGPGARVLLHGMSTTVLRDAVFGVVYEVGRTVAGPVRGDTPVQAVLATAGAAALATLFSAPFNYVRSIQYAHLVDSSQPRRRILMQLSRLWENAKQQPNRLTYLGQRLRIGWGTARVAVSMCLAQTVFAELKNRLGHKIET